MTKFRSVKYFLKVENNADKANKTAEIILAVPGDDIVVKRHLQVLKKV
jgi:putative sigma-54 modulation protein